MDAKHILVARTQGVEAGLAAYMSTLAGKNSPTGKAIKRAKSAKTKIAAYCAKFGEQIETVQTPAQANATLDHAQIIAEAVAAALAKAGVTPEVEEPATQAGKGTSSTKTAVACITAGEAWEAAGGGETFKPKDLNKPANNGQLYRLNTSGKLALRS